LLFQHLEPMRKVRFSTIKPKGRWKMPFKISTFLTPIFSDHH
jgi:hypothetical protein